MAALSIMTDVPPRWTKQGGHWVENSSSSSWSRSPSNESRNRSPIILDTDVLVTILTLLEKMDSEMELQAKRLEILEITGSPDSSSSGDTTVLNDNPLSKRPSVRTVSSKLTAAALAIELNEEENEYARSIMKMKQFLSEVASVVDGEHSDEASMPGEPARPDSGAFTARPDQFRPVTPEADVYSVSVYSGDLLSGSKMSLGLSHHLERRSMPLPPSEHAPPSPPASESDVEDQEDIRSTVQNELPAQNQGTVHLSAAKDGTHPNAVEFDAVSNPPPALPSSSPLRRHISISISEKRSSSPYIKIELGLYTFDSWKRLRVLPKIKSGSRVLWEHEKVIFHHVHRTSYHVMQQAQKGLIRAGRAVERKWKEEKAKKGVKILRWRIAISFSRCRED